MASSVTSSFVATFERQRQERLLNLLIPIGAALTAIAFVGGMATIVLGQAPPAMPLTASLTFALLIGMLGAREVLHRGYVELATRIFAISAMVVVLAVVAVLCLATSFSAQSLVQLACLSLVIVLVGTVGDIRTVLVAMVLDALVIGGILLLRPADGILMQTTSADRFILIIAVLTYHGAIALLVIAVQRTLSQTIGTLSETRQALTEAQEVDELKDQFITHVNHELRTPVMSLQGYVDLIYELDDSLTSADRRDLLEKARHAGETLQRFVNDVLDTRRIGHDTVINPVFTPVHPALNAALALIDPHEAIINQRPIRVHMPHNLAIWGDPVRLQQILANLISNAVKYSPSGTPVEITGYPTDAGVEIVVRDYGLGIPPDQIQLLFHRFVRLPRDLKSTVRGTGVGLYLCRMYAEAMGGAIRIESKGVPGQGSRFILQLPAPLPETAFMTMTPTVKRMTP